MIYIWLVFPNLMYKLVYPNYFVKCFFLLIFNKI